MQKCWIVVIISFATFLSFLLVCECDVHKDAFMHVRLFIDDLKAWSDLLQLIHSYISCNHMMSLQEKCGTY